MLKAGRDLERKGQELDMNQEEVGDSERRREMKCFFLPVISCHHRKRCWRG